MKKTLLFLLMALFTVAVGSAQFTVGNTTYTVTDATNKFVDVTKNITDTAVVIPEKVTDAGGTGLEYTVVAIGANAFNPGTNPGTVMTTIQLPASVKEIKTQAFRSSLLQSISFTTVNGLEKIQSGAFRIAAAVTSIDNILASTAPTLTIYGGAVFQQMTMPSVVFPGNTIVFAADALNLFNASPSITSINFSGTALTAIPGQMFRSTGISTINFSGTTITALGASVFQSCLALKTVNLGNVNNVGNSCFTGCTALKSIVTNQETVPTTGTTIFSGLTDLYLATVKLYVPTVAAQIAFEADAQWGKLDVVVGTFNTWLGTTSSAWETASNWSTGTVPTSTEIIDIPSGTINSPILSSNVTIDVFFNVKSGANLTIKENATLNFVGSVVNNGELILKSSASGTANLLSASLVSNVTQQRYLSSNQRGWRLLSNPLATTTFSALATDSGITLGTGFTGQYQSTSNTWTSTDGTVAMASQQAYKVFITATSNATLINKGSAPSTVPATITTVAGKYYLVANPYTAPVSLVSILAASTNLSNSVSYYNPETGSGGVRTVKAGGYETIIVSGIVGSATDIVLPPMGAIFVQATAVGTINIPKTAIYTGTPLQTATYNQKVAQTQIVTPNALTINVSSNGVDYDKLQLRFKDVGATGSNIDFGKLPNTFLDFYSIDNGNNKAISELELKEQTIPLGITSTIEKSFSFKVAENTIPAGYEAVLVDNVLNTSTVLVSGTSYDFVIDATTASQGNARFAINMKPESSLSVKANELQSKIQLWPNPAHNQFNILNKQSLKDGESTIEISNLSGQMIHSQKSNPGSTTTIQTNGWAAGVYMIKATNNGSQTTKKLIIQ